MSKEIKPEYLGDGVYASFDGIMIKLEVERSNEQGRAWHEVIYLEPDVYQALTRLANKCWNIKDK